MAATFAPVGTSSKAVRAITSYNKWFHALYGVEGTLTLQRVHDLHEDAFSAGRPVPAPAITGDNFGATRETQALTAYNAEQAGMGWFMALTHRFDAADRNQENGNALGASAQPYMGAGIEIDRKHFTMLECKGLWKNAIGNYHALYLLGSRKTALHGQFRWSVWNTQGSKWDLNDSVNGWISGVWDEGLPEQYEENGVYPEWAHPKPWYFYAATFAKNIAHNEKLIRRNPATPWSDMWTMDFFIPAEFHAAFWFGVRKQLGNRAGFTGQQWWQFYKDTGITPPRPMKDYETEEAGL